jgi:FAD/FMN-containing dehydrogenase
MTAVPIPNLPNALARIRAIVGDKGCVTDPEAMAPFLIDDRKKFLGKTPMIVRPATTLEVAAVVELCAQHGLAIVPQGGNTGLCGAQIPSPAGAEIVLNLSRLNRVRDVDPINYTITAEAGCILAEVQAKAAEVDRLMPLSLAAEGSCEIGGNLSTNAGGINVLRYGMARDLVLGIEVVLPDGRIWDGLRRLRKDNTGYDLKHLFIGAEGTLGIITAAVLKLFPRPREVVTALLAVPDLDSALALMVQAREASGDKLTAFELMERICFDFALRHVPGTHDPLNQAYDHYVLLELSSSETGGLRATMESILESAIEHGTVIDGTIAANDAQAKALWRIRETQNDAQKPEGGSIKHDVSVPVGQVPEFIRRASAFVTTLIPGARPVAFGHVGDGNVHFNVSQPIGADRARFLARWPDMNHGIHDIAHALGGSFSAEHGVGVLKRDELVRFKSPVEIELMRRIKAAIDPQGLMNPGKVLEP